MKIDAGTHSEKAHGVELYDDYNNPVPVGDIRLKNKSSAIRTI